MKQLFEIYSEVEKKCLALYSFNKQLSIPIQALRASFIKCLHFNIMICERESKDNLMFFMPMLRGICEDIIYHNYIFNVLQDEDKLNFIAMYQILDLEKSVSSQEDFFTTIRPSQPIVTKSILHEFVISKNFVANNIMEELKTKYDWKKNPPSVFQLAEIGKISNIYKYLYAATSRLVHFNPQSLFQMIWGEFENRENREIKSMKISIDNYQKYYNHFCIFYGYYLLKIFVEKLGGILGIDIKSEMESLEDCFKQIRWPEIITFEELNIPLKYGISNFKLEKEGFEGYMSNLMHKLLQRENDDT